MGRGEAQADEAGPKVSNHERGRLLAKAMLLVNRIDWTGAKPGRRAGIQAIIDRVQYGFDEADVGILREFLSDVDEAMRLDGIEAHP